MSNELWWQEADETSALKCYYELNDLNETKWCSLEQESQKRSSWNDYLTLNMDTNRQYLQDEADPLGLFPSITEKLGRAGKLKESEHFLLSSPLFDPKEFIRFFHRNSTDVELQDGKDKIEKAYSAEAANVRMLVVSNFDKFISAKQMIEKVHSNMKQGMLQSGKLWGMENTQTDLINLRNLIDKKSRLALENEMYTKSEEELVEFLQDNRAYFDRVPLIKTKLEEMDIEAMKEEFRSLAEKHKQLTKYVESLEEDSIKTALVQSAWQKIRRLILEKKNLILKESLSRCDVEDFIFFMKFFDALDEENSSIFDHLEVITETFNSKIEDLFHNMNKNIDICRTQLFSINQIKSTANLQKLIESRSYERHCDSSRTLSHLQFFQKDLHFLVQKLINCLKDFSISLGTCIEKYCSTEDLNLSENKVEKFAESKISESAQKCFDVIFTQLHESTLSLTDFLVSLTKGELNSDNEFEMEDMTSMRINAISLSGFFSIVSLELKILSGSIEPIAPSPGQKQLIIKMFNDCHRCISQAVIFNLRKSTCFFTSRTIEVSLLSDDDIELFSHLLENHLMQVISNSAKAMFPASSLNESSDRKDDIQFNDGSAEQSLISSALITANTTIIREIADMGRIERSLQTSQKNEVRIVLSFLTVLKFLKNLMNTTYPRIFKEIESCLGFKSESFATRLMQSLNSTWSSCEGATIKISAQFFGEILSDGIKRRAQTSEKCKDNTYEVSSYCLKFLYKIEAISFSIAGRNNVYRTIVSIVSESLRMMKETLSQLENTSLHFLTHVILDCEFLRAKLKIYDETLSNDLSDIIIIAENKMNKALETQLDVPSPDLLPILDEANYSIRNFYINI